jgi:hypothetical protein
LEERYEGIRIYEKELVKILKERNRIDNYKLLEILKIDPKDSDLVKAISKQLENLEAYGLVEATINGWRWIG